MPKVGDKAPDFELESTSGNKIRLSELKGKKVVLYFYPKDDTPGCTKEACDIRDNFAQVKQYAQVFGVSADDNKSHKKFTEKYSLPFELLSDTEKKTLEDYGVWTQKSMFGKKYMGIQRATFLIDEEGNIQKVWPKVSVMNHIQEILTELQK